MAIDKFSNRATQLPILRHTITESGTLIVPPGVTHMYLLVAGGGGSASNPWSGPYGSSGEGNAAGGGGGVAQGWVRVVPGETLTCTVAAAGGTSIVSSAGDFRFSYSGLGGGGGSSSVPGTHTNGAGGTTTIVNPPLTFVNIDQGTLTTTTIALGSAPHYSGAGGSGSGLTGGGGNSSTVGGGGLAGTPTATGGAGIVAISTNRTGGVGGGGGGGITPVGQSVNNGGVGAIKIFY